MDATIAKDKAEEEGEQEEVNMYYQTRAVPSYLNCRFRSSMLHTSSLLYRGEPSLGSRRATPGQERTSLRIPLYHKISTDLPTSPPGILDQYKLAACVTHQSNFPEGTAGSIAHSRS
ncbi:hypothetical protein LIA77_04846 [Sarocladium implicatum]|nr:hypothetical protein LIA77_04846 [Sarocladium implicatum]